MTETQPKRPHKTIDRTVEIDADPKVVWEAISSAEGLRRWFPLDAQMEPGVGGFVEMSWGDYSTGRAQIDVWEEGRRLRTVEDCSRGAESVQVAVDYTIEGRDGRTILRMVNSGFQAGEDWDEMIDTMDSGWRYFLWNLKVYVERHHGTARRMIWSRRTIHVPKPDAWGQLFGAQGLVPTAHPVRPGAAAQLWSGHQGTVEQVNEPIHLACRFPSLDDALLLVELEPGRGSYSLGVWLSLYGTDAATGDAIEAQLKERLDRMAATWLGPATAG